MTPLVYNWTPKHYNTDFNTSLISIKIHVMPHFITEWTSNHVTPDLGLVTITSLFELITMIHDLWWLLWIVPTVVNNASAVSRLEDTFYQWGPCVLVRWTEIFAGSMDLFWGETNIFSNSSTWTAQLDYWVLCIPCYLQVPGILCEINVFCWSNGWSFSISSLLCYVYRHIVRARYAYGRRQLINDC